MIFIFNLNGYSNFISMWKIFLTTHISCKTYVKGRVTHELGDGHVLQLFQNSFCNSNISCSYALSCVLIMDSINSVNSLKFVSDGPAKASNRCTTNKIAVKTYFNAKSNHIMNHEEKEPNTCEPAKREKLLAQDIDPSCPEKLDCGPSKWQRRDSFSSCSSDSAVYCSSRHTQVDAIAQDVMKKKLIAETNGKKRQRNSSGSSALSSASDSSNKDVTNSHVADILSCLENHAACSEQDFPKLSSSTVSQSQVSTQSSVSRYPSVVTSTVTSQSEIATIVEEKTVSFTCKSFEKSPPKNDRHHNLRQRIRRKTCHNCDCGGPHTTVYVRRYTQIKRETTTKHSIPKVKHLQQTSPLHHGVASHQGHMLPKQQSPVRETNSYEEKKFPLSPQDRANRKRRTEVDKLYDALHEIEWAKHISPDNILSQIDFRRAAKLSFYSSKNKTEPASSPSASSSSEKAFKSPGSLQRNHLNRIGCGKRKFVPEKCTYSLRRHGSFVVQDSTKSNGISLSNKKLQANHSFNKNKKVSVKPVTDAINDGNSEKLAAVFTADSEDKKIQNSDLEQIENFRGGDENSDITDNYVLCSGSSDNSNMTDLCFGSAQSKECISKHEADGKDSVSNIALSGSLETNAIFNNKVASPSIKSEDLHLGDAGDVFSLPAVPKEMSFWNTHEKSEVENSSQEKTKPTFFDQCVVFESFQVSPKEGDIVIECLHPDIIDIETSNVCCEEVVVTEVDSDQENPLASPPLPLLTKVTPLREHSSDEGPPLLEPCEGVNFPNNTETFSHTLNETECSESSIHRRLSDSEKPNQNHVDSEVGHSEELETADSATSNSELKSTNDSIGVQAVATSLRRRSARNHRTVSNQNLIKKNLFKKYFNQSKKTRLKDVPISTSLPKPASGDVKQNSGDKDPIPTAASDSIVRPIPQTISTFGEEDRNNLIKNDSLRVHVRGLDHITVRNHMQHYDSVFECKTIAHQSVTCSNVQTSSVQTTTSRKCVQFEKKEELQSKRDRRVGKRAKSACAVKDDVLPLEYKNGDNAQIPYNFTIHYRFITVNKNDGYTQVVFKLTEGLNTYLTAESLIELRDTLYNAGNDSRCQVLIVNSIGRSFCLGLDLRPLLGSQKNAASKKIAVAVKDFIEALAAFNKPLVIVVNGAAVGLGVTMLAYSDVILSSDAATFHMPYSKLGFSPEGGATLMLPFVVGSTIAMDMLLRGRTLSAYEACGYGLVSEVLTASQIPLKLIERVRQLAESPSSAMETTKSMLRMHLYQRLSLALESETAMLPKQWLSESCQSALQQALTNGSLI